MDSKIKPRLVELLTRYPLGITSGEAMLVLGVSQNGLCRAAKALEAAGQVVRMQRSYTQVMCLPEHAAEVRAHMRKQAEARADAERLRKAEWRRIKDAAKRQWYAPVLCDVETPVQLRVRAEKAKPLPKQGPASVFEWGAR